MTGPSVLLIAPFDEVSHPHMAQRGRALERLGCDVTTFDLRRRTTLLGLLGSSDLRSRIMRSVDAAEPDVILVIGGYELDESAVKDLRTSSGVKIVNWFPDDMNRIQDIVRVARAYDEVFVAGSDVASSCERAFGRPVEVLPLAADPSVYRPLKTKDKYRANVVFAGSASRTREAALSELLEYGLALWGPGWRKTSLRNYCRGEIRSTPEFVRAYGGATIGINLHQGFGALSSSDAFCNQRLFELAMMGVPQIVDARADLPKYFEVGKEVLAFTNARELKTLVGELLQSPQLVDDLAAAGRRRALSEHTYMHRMQRLLKAIAAPAPQSAPNSTVAI